MKIGDHSESLSQPSHLWCLASSRRLTDCMIHSTCSETCRDSMTDSYWTWQQNYVVHRTFKFCQHICPIASYILLPLAFFLPFCFLLNRKNASRPPYLAVRSMTNWPSPWNGKHTQRQSKSWWSMVITKWSHNPQTCSAALVVAKTSAIVSS